MNIRYPIYEGVYRILTFYRSTSAKRSELKFFVRDNFGREREMTVTFDLESTTAKE